MVGLLQFSSPLHHESCPADICLVSGFVLQQIVCHAGESTFGPLKTRPNLAQVVAWQRASCRSDATCH